MKRLGRTLAMVSWLTALTLVPIPWDELGRLDLSLPSLPWGSAWFRLPFGNPLQPEAAVAAPAAAQNAFAAESVVLQRPGALGVGTRGEIKPTLDFADSVTRGAGVTIRLEAPAEPVLELELRLRGVPGREPRQEPGGRHVYDLPADGAAQSQGPRSLLVTDDDLLAQAATRTPGPAQAGTPTRTPAASASLTPTAATTGTPAATSTPAATTTATTVSATPTATSQPSGPQGGNRYGARIELRYEETPDGGVKETLRFLDRPRTNVLEYELDARGLTVAPQADGSLRLLDHAGRHAFTIPAPTFEDARGQKGSASYRLTDKKLEVVLDQVLVNSGALPLEVDPSIVSAASLWENAPPPWQRQSVVAADGTQAFFYYDSTSGSTGIKFVTSTDNFASVSSATTVVSGQGAGGFSVETDQATNKIYVALTGAISGSNRLRLYPLSYSGATNTWTVGTAVDVQSHASTSWSGATVAIERGATDYLWVGADERSSNLYTYKAWYADLSSIESSPTWTAASPGFAAGTTAAHYGALLAITGGLAAVARDGTAQKGATYTRAGGWATPLSLTTDYAWDSGKQFSLVAVADPLASGTSVTTFVPMVAFPGNGVDGEGNPVSTAIKLYTLRYGATSWTSTTTAAGASDSRPQVTSDGTGFYLFRLKRNATLDKQINGQRGQLIGGGSPSVDIEADRAWIIESPSANKDLEWLALPRTLGTEIIPFFYIRDKSTDELVVQAKRVDLLGVRDSWEFQEIELQGAGDLMVNLANGNLHYEMTDASFPSRQIDDEIARAYDSQSDVSTIFGAGWTSPATAKLQFYELEVPYSTGSNGRDRVVYSSGDGRKLVFLKNPDGSWRSELGIYSVFSHPNTSSTKDWKITEPDGRVLYFDNNGNPTIEQDRDTATYSSRTWTYTNGVLSSITGATGRTQTFTLTSGKVTRIRLANPSPNQGTYFDYDYTYDGNGRLQYVTLVSNSTEFDATDANKRVRITYGYDTSGRLNSITTPEGNVYTLGYDTAGRVAWIDLPDPSTGAQSTCGQTHCWQFAYAEGQGQTTVTDPRGSAWAYSAFGSGAIYEVTDPASNTTQRTWTAHQNKASETNPLSNRWDYEYDTNGNRTKIVDPVNGTSKPAVFAFNSYRRPTSRILAQGSSVEATTTSTYKSNNLDLDTVTRAISSTENAVTTYNTYDSYGLPTQVTDPRGKVTTMTYDSHGQLETETRPDSSKTTYTRDLWGRVTAERVGGTTANDSTDHITVSTYDDLGRLKSTRVRMGSNSTQDDAADLVTSQTYDREDNEKTVTDPRGNVTATTYDRRGRVVAIDSPIGNGGSDNTDRPCTAYEYDQADNRTKVRVAVSRGVSASCSFNASGITWSETQTSYNSRNRRTDQTLVVSSSEYSGGTITSSWQYDNGGRVTRITDARGNYADLTYDANGRKLTETKTVTLGGTARTRQLRWTYTEVGSPKESVVPRGSGATPQEETTSRGYDRLRRVTSATNELTKNWSTTYDRNGNKLTETDPLNHTTMYTYDDANRVSTVSDALSNQASNTYDKFGNRLTETDPNGDVTTLGYDKANRLASVTDAAGTTSSFTYDKNSNRLTITDPRGKTHSFQYDALNRLTQETTPNATATYNCSPTCATDEVTRTATYAYTLDGKVRTATDFNGTTITYGYDSARRLSSIDYSDSTPDVGYTYDKNGNRLTMSEGGSTTATYTYHELNRQLTETRGSNVLTYGYDRRDITSVTYPDGKVVSYTYDAADRLQYLDDWRGSGTGRTSFIHDDANRTTTRTLPTSAYTSWSYDNANRLTQVEHKASSGGAVLARFSWTYDQASNRITQTDYDGTNTDTQAFEYDSLARLIRETPRSGISTVPLTYSYDAAGNRTATGTGQALVEDNSGSLSYSGGNTSTNNTNASGGSYTRISGTGNYVDFSFSGNAVTFVYSTDSDAGTVRLTLDPAGANTTLGDINQCAATSWQNEKTFTGLSNGTHTLRVTFQSTCPGSVDNHANIDAFRAYTQGKTYSYDDDNRLKQLVDGGTTTTFTYNKNGSQTKKTTGTDVTTYTFDGARRLTDVSLNGSSLATFAYDGNGARTSKTVATVTARYTNDTRALTHVLQETTFANTLTYITDLLQYDPSQAANAQWSYFHLDAQNNRLLTDAASTVSKRWEYDPFGVPRTQTGTATSSFRYGREQLDPETSLINLRARYYDPILGRFITRDSLNGSPLSPATLNRYSYVVNNPLNLRDPSGLCNDPGPQGEDAVRYCVEAFTNQDRTELVFVIPPGTLLTFPADGDGRGYDPGDTRFRSAQWLSVPSDGDNPSYVDAVTETHVWLDQLGITKYTLTGRLNNCGWDRRTQRSRIYIDFWCSAYAGPATLPVPNPLTGNFTPIWFPLRYRMTIMQYKSNKGSKAFIKSVNGSVFPSLEVYQYRDDEEPRLVFGYHPPAALNHANFLATPDQDIMKKFRWDRD